MKKLLMGAIVLSSFAIALTLVQMSCSKSNAQTIVTNDTTTLRQLGKLLFIKNRVTPTQYWICDYDGSNKMIIPIVLPANYEIDASAYSQARLSPDGKKIFFGAHSINLNPGQTRVYSCNIDGSGLQNIVTDTVYNLIQGAY